MLAAHNDNLLRPRGLAPKTPGARRLLHDENAVTMGKKVLGGPARDQNQENTVLRGKQTSFATPMASAQTRAPLGMKTTNAKARTNHLGGGKQVLKDNIDNAVSRPKPKPTVFASSKLDIRCDPKPAKPESEVECASIAPEIPYESDILPIGGLSLNCLKPENLFGGYYEHFIDPTNDKGKRLHTLKLEEDFEKALRASEQDIMRDIENTDWTVADVPESQQHLRKKKTAVTSRPASVTSNSRLRHTRAASSMSTRSAASTLGSAPASTLSRVRQAPLVHKHTKMPSWLQPKKQPVQGISDPIKATVSQTTIGYSKGRSASASIREPRSAAGTDSLGSMGPEETVVVPSPTHKHTSRPQFVSIFDVAEESDQEDSFKAGSQAIDYDDDDFQL
ncbi:hypothetical protein Cpir12675_001440 [Ceratocystis pirilliformis]|uniref:Uncharacterized protein n=1 Tax=Ceratocystis pirilliformis TaxID=259994 RepID=A0ABR3ZIM8_9PEZI